MSYVINFSQRKNVIVFLQVFHFNHLKDSAGRCLRTPRLKPFGFWFELNL